MNGSYVEDLLRVGNREFRDLWSHTHRRFETSGDDDLPVTFAGFEIARESDGSFTIDQTFYLKRLEQLDLSSTFENFRSLRMKVAWLANTRPDLQFEISQLAQVTQERFAKESKEFLKRLNSATRYAYDNVAHLKFQMLDQSSLRICWESRFERKITEEESHYVGPV